MIKLSPGNSKLGSIMNTSVRPVYDCKKNAPCASKCYALKSWNQYMNVRNAWTHNSKWWRADYVGSAISVIEQLYAKRSAPKYFRIHVAGDFINQTHVNAWILIALACQGTKFRAFTKRYDLNFHRAPKNLIIGYSMWPGVKDTAPKGIRAWVQDGTETRIPTNAFHCLGDCSSCKTCWDSPGDVWFDIH